MSHVTELSKYIRLVADWDEDTEQLTQVLVYQRKGHVSYNLDKPFGGVRVLLKAVSNSSEPRSNTLPFAFLMSQAFSEFAFFVEKDYEENEGKGELSNFARARILRDLAEAIETYQVWDAVKEHPKGYRDYLIEHDHDNLEVIVVPYITKEKLWPRHGDNTERYELMRKVMMKVKVSGTRDAVIRDFAIGALYSPVPELNYHDIIDDIVNKYHLNDQKE